MRLGRGVAIATLVLAAVMVRAVGLGADPPANLSWSTGIYTDEAYYASDSRSEVLFGHDCLGGFHSALVVPTLNAVQRAAFRLFGVSLVCDRSISVVLGLLTVWLLFIGLRAAYGESTAVLGATLLAFSAFFVLYNRLALVETPAACCLTAAFAAGMRGQDKVSRRSAFATGFWTAIAVITKPVTAACALGVLVAKRSRETVALAAGLLGTVAAYLLTVLLPHHAELAHMGRYYALHQYLPHSLTGLCGNLDRSWWTGARDGVLPTTVHWAPVLAPLAVVALLKMRRGATDADKWLALWIVAPMAVFSLLDYTPSRYYVLFWPALCGLAARTLSAYPRQVVAVVLALFIGIDGTRIACVLAQPSFNVASASRAMIIRPNTVAIGQFAPELCFDRRVAAYTVQPGLANDVHPVERLHATEVFVTRAPYWEQWWRQRYPTIMQPQNVEASITIKPGLVVDVYGVPKPTFPTHLPAKRGASD